MNPKVFMICRGRQISKETITAQCYKSFEDNFPREVKAQERSPNPVKGGELLQGQVGAKII